MASMMPTWQDIAVVSEIAAAFLQEPVRSIQPIGQGSNNKNFLVETTAEEMIAFRQGYGLSDEEHRRLKPELDRLFLLTSFDKLRWAIDRSRSRIEEFVERAKTALSLNLGRT